MRRKVVEVRELFCKSHNSWNIHFTSHQNLGKLQKHHRMRNIASKILFFLFRLCFFGFGSIIKRWSTTYTRDREIERVGRWKCSAFYFRSIKSNRNCNILSTSHFEMSPMYVYMALLRNKYMADIIRKALSRLQHKFM